MDTTSNMLTSLKNAIMAGKPDVVLPYTRLNNEILKVLKSHNYVSDLTVKKNKKTSRQEIHAKPTYVGEDPVINNVRRISKSSRRLYAKANDLRDTRQGYGILIVSTPKGVMTGADAHKENVGGEIIAEIW